MSKSARMFEIIQILRACTSPKRAQDIADELEVTKRTIYRDIAALQGMRVPIEGEAGIGYIIRPGFELPPLNFTMDEAEAITVGIAMIARTGDKGLNRAARSVAKKLSDATQLSQTVFAATWGVDEPDVADLSLIRQAIREERKLRISYRNGEGKESDRTIWPIAIAYHTEAVVIAGWCELRHGMRHFRPDRIRAFELLDECFIGQGANLREEWHASYLEWLE